MYFVFVPVPISIQLPPGSQVVSFDALPEEVKAKFAQQLRDAAQPGDNLAIAETEPDEPVESSDERRFLERCFDLPEQGN
ncbi:MAG TPA: hypothetical protein V6D22_16170 [Candidatus Obscuribacterales bacterium]